MLVCTAICVTDAQAEPKSGSKSSGSRLEELFVWKVSEGLELPAEQEVKFTETIRELNLQKKKAAEALEESVSQLAKAKTKLEVDKALAAHRKALKAHHDIQLAELDRLKSLFGSEKLARYLVMKSELSEKLKELLSAPNVEGKPASPKGGAAPMPRIIEGK